VLTHQRNETEATVDVRTEGDALIVRVKDPQLDSRSAPVVGRRLAWLIRSGHRRMALDLSSVEFIDSAGLSLLVSVEQQLGRHGGFVISSPSNNVMNILKLTRLAKVFRIFFEERQALAALQRMAG
jgi:anti-sigma B factor antagonist